MTKVELMEIVIAKDEFIRFRCTLQRFCGDDHRLPGESHGVLAPSAVNGYAEGKRLFLIFLKHLSRFWQSMIRHDDFYAILIRRSEGGDRPWLPSSRQISSPDSHNANDRCVAMPVKPT